MAGSDRGERPASPRGGPARRAHRDSRPVWQRVVLPGVGVLCMLVGIIGVIAPVIPGWPLFIIGAPLLVAFSRRWERWVRLVMRRSWQRIRHWRRDRRARRGPADADSADETQGVAHSRHRS